MMLKSFLKQVLIPVTMVGVCIFLLYSAYQNVKDEAINQLIVEQRTHAKQAANGIELFFKEYDLLLSYLIKQNSVIELNDNGRELINTLYNSHAPEIRAITRVDERGKIIYTIPNNSKFAGTDISRQEHIQRLLKTQQRVLSDVFETVQGYRSIAYYLPVFKNGVFKGGLAILIPFDNLAKNYLHHIRVRRTGFAWIISQRGVVIYSPLQQQNNQNAFNLYSGAPSLISILNKASEGLSGSGYYSWSDRRHTTTDSINHVAVYSPIKIADRFWSIIVTTPEVEALSTMKEFIDKWIIIAFLLIAGSLFYLYYIIKARAVLKEETKRKKAEEALKQSEQKFKTLFHTAGDAIFLLSLDGNFIEVNESASEKFGYSREEFLQLSVFELNLPGTQLEVSNRLKALREQGDLYFESIYRTKAGEPIPVGVNIRLIDYEDSRVALSIARDISLKKREEAELVRAKEEAEKASKLKSEFLAQMSHEIRSPLNVVVGFTQLLRDDLKEQMTDDMLNTFKGIDNAGKRIIRTVELILNMSELQTGMYESSQNEFDLAEDVLSRIFDEYELTARKKGLEFRFMKNTTDTIVSADFYSTSQIFVNLVDNAIKYTQSGQVELIIERNRNNDLTVIVSDTGIGISKDFLPRLFDPFTQEEQGYTRKYEGTGLGMALVKRYCEINNVDIKIETDKRTGTVFTLCFLNSPEKSL